MKILRRVLVGLAILLAVLIGAGVGVRYSVRTEAGRALVVKALDGMDLGAIGRLHVEGMGGDLFDAFGFRRLSIIDSKGVWLDAQTVTLDWDPVELLGRRVHLTHLHAGLIRVLRQPTLKDEPRARPGKPPVSLILDEVKLRLETAPAFSVQHGLWDVAAQADLRRNGRMRAALAAKSLLHAGDGLTLALRVGRRDRFLLRADAVEAGGGALAGALGLPADRSLTVHAEGDGTSAAGQAQLRATSGPTTPLDGRAHWDKTGAAASGRMSLSASRLLKAFADRLGPDALIDLKSGRPKGDVYTIDGALRARDGSLRVSGPVNWAKRSTSGLAVTLSVADFSKWLGVLKIGPAKTAGVVSGGLGDFTFKGVFQGEKLDQYGYALPRIAGPTTVSLKNQEWRLQADLTGAGGRGKGTAAALLGADPRVQLDVSRLKEGHVLFRTVNVAGSGLKVSAQGGQGLFGRLSFKGAVQIAGLGLLRPGAKGQLAGSWDAGENKDGRAWDFAFDGRGSGVSSGWVDLDHFLGAAPKLTAKGRYGSDGLIFDDVKLVGATLQAGGKGALDPRQQLAVDFDWTAKGPIVAGPLEIAGAAKGTGKVTGTLTAPRADFEAELASLDLGPLAVTPARLTMSFLQGPDGLTGAAAVSGPTAKYGAATAKAAFRFDTDGVDLSDIVADAGGVKLSGRLALRSGEPSSADLSVVAGAGAFLTSGRLSGKIKIVDQPADASGDIALDGVDVEAIGAPTTFRTLSLRAQGPLKQMAFQAAATSVSPVAWKFTGMGVLNHAPTVNQITLQGSGRIRKADFKLLEPAVLRFGGSDQTAQMKVAIAGGQALIDARQKGDGLSAKADLANVGLAAFSDDFTGTVSGVMTMQGRGGHLSGSLDAALAGARSRDEPANEGLIASLKAVLDDTRLHIDAVATNAEGLKSKGVLDLPTEASAAPFRIAVDRTKPLKGSFSADGEVRPLWDLFAGGERTLSGHVTTSGVVQGSLNQFQASGQGALSGGKFRDVVTGLALQNLDVDTAFGDDAVTVRRFSGKDPRGGTVSGEGRVSFAEDGASTFTLNLKQFQLIDNDLGRATASGAVTVTHPAKGQGKLSGKLVIDRADIVAATPTPTGVVPMDVVEVHQVMREGEEKPQPRTLGPPILMDVSIKADRGVYVKGKGLNVELSLDSHVGGTISQPELTGVAKVVGGSYDFAGKRFDVDTSGQVRLGTTPAQIRLNLSATWEDPTLTAVVKVQGTAAKPEITLTSTPVLPQDEVLSRVLFGVSAAQLSPAQGAELASALASLTGGGGFDVIGNLRQFAGLDRLALGGTTTGETTISGGKYISKDVYLELTGGGRNGSGAQVEWRIRHDLSLVSRYGAALDPRYSNDTDTSLSIRFRKDF
jgi:translocation and assembly module TamB